jgi:hypothetical protein
MALSQKQQALIVAIDRTVKTIVLNGGNEEVILEMLPVMSDIKALIDSVPKKEIELYFYEYDGFYCYFKMLEKLAEDIAADHI